MSFLLKKKAYAGSFTFLFQFEEIGCRIASNACGGLWRQCYRKQRAEIGFAGSMTTKKKVVPASDCDRR